MYTIIDTQDNTVVAIRKTLAASRKWCKGLNEGFKVVRYTVAFTAN